MSTHQPLTAKYPAGSLPDYRVVRVHPVTNELALCGASDTDAWAFTQPKVQITSAPTFRRLLITRKHLYPLNYPDANETAQGSVTWWGGGGVPAADWNLGVTLEAAAGASFSPGVVAYQAADGKISHTGTVRVGRINVQIDDAPLALWEVIVD
jgi:hypothetical protein